MAQSGSVQVCNTIEVDLARNQVLENNGPKKKSLLFES